MKKKKFLINVAVAAAVLGSQNAIASNEDVEASKPANYSFKMIHENELTMVKNQDQPSNLKLSVHSSHASHASHGSHSSHSSGY